MGASCHVTRYNLQCPANTALTREYIKFWDIPEISVVVTERRGYSHP